MQADISLAGVFARFDDHLDAIGQHAPALGLAVHAAGLGAAVPTCPGWTARDLVNHIGGIHRWAAANLARGSVSDAETDEMFIAPGGPEILSWYAEGHAALIATLGGADPGVECVTFLPNSGSPLEFWARRQAHETAIHRVDACSARGEHVSFTPDFAADGIDELVGGFVARRGGRLFRDPPATVMITPTDVAAAWRVRIEPDRREVAAIREPAGAGPADLTIAGIASDLYLLLWNRGTRERVTLSGDPALLDLWHDSVTVRWS